MVIKDYVWVKDGKPVEVVTTCGGEPILNDCRCKDCRGEECHSGRCIDTLLLSGEIKEIDNMKLIEALQKWNRVTNDGGKTVYGTDGDGTVVMHTNGASGGFKPTLELFNSTGWVKYTKPLVLPERERDMTYYCIDSYGDIELVADINCWIDDAHFDSYNYIQSRSLAEYIKDKQFIQRVSIMLNHLNKDNPDKEMLISEYIEDRYKKVLDRIKKYEEA